MGRLFPASTETEAVSTHRHLALSPEDAWSRLVFFEDVPGRAPWPLRALLPQPVRTSRGSKEVGELVECTYTSGRLTKRITVRSRPHVLRFEVLAQELGIETCVTTVEGSYELRAAEHGTAMELTTRYRSNLRPRWLWRPFERVIAHQLHRHILSGVEATWR